MKYYPLMFPFLFSNFFLVAYDGGTKERKIYLLGRNQHQPVVASYLKSIRVLKGKLPLDWYKNVLWDMSKTKLKTKM
jgi:hypothetical protein